MLHSYYIIIIITIITTIITTTIIIIINTTTIIIILSSTCISAQLLQQFRVSACCNINLSTNEKGAEGQLSPTNDGTQHRLEPHSCVQYSAPYDNLS